METRRAITLAYVLALLIIAGLALLTHVLVTRVLHEQDGAAEVINIAGRQRMLSQRVALFAFEYEQHGRAEDRARLRDAIDLMAQQHDMLTDPREGTPFHSLRGERLQRLYTDEGLDARVRDFIAMARVISEGQRVGESDGSDALRDLAAAELLNRLDYAVKLYEIESDDAIQNLTRIQLYALGILLIVLVAEAMLIFRPLVNTVGRQADALQKLAHTDELTELANRRAFNAQAQRELEVTRRSGRALSLLLLDLDRFKSVNDSYGHDAGDRVLRSCAKVIAAELRGGDFGGRTGGEEFCILMPATDATGASKLAERLLQRLASTAIDVDDTTQVHITFSGGVAEYRPGETREEWMKRADLAMYEAKQSGRARIVVASQVDDS